MGAAWHGAGKTTLMRMIADIMASSSGTICYDGADINYLLDILTLSDVKKKKIAKLSGGMKRRVGIAQAMLNNPKNLVMDEPTAGLDPGERVRFRNFISEFSHDRIVLISTHIVSDIEYISTKNAIMKAGKIVDVGTTDELVKEIKGKVWTCTISAKDLASYEMRLRIINQRSEDNSQVSIRYLSEVPEIEGSIAVEPRLEDLYLWYFPQGNMEGRKNDMRIFCLEVKRMMKSQRTLILIAVALLMSIVMAYMPISFESINCPQANGGRTELDGLAAIQFKKDYYKREAGDITPQKLAEALRTYQSYVKEYGTLDDVPLDIYVENIMAIRPMLKGLTEAFANPKTGIGAELMDINPDDVEQHFYEKSVSYLEAVMNLEQKDYETARHFAADKYAKVGKPFYSYPGMSRDAFDYIYSNLGDADSYVNP